MSVRAVFHLFATVQFFYACYYDWNYVKVPVKIHRMGEEFGQTGKLKFLTYWDSILQTVFFAVCFANDLIGTNENVPRNKPVIRKVRDGLLSCLAFPLSMFVGLTFWGLYAVDRELVFPKALDSFFPLWLNHVMHTNIMIFILIELATSFRSYPSRKFGLSVLSLFMLVYLVWIHIIHAYSGFWVYPVLDQLNFPLRIVFFLCLLGLSVALYIVGEKFNSFIWSKQLRSLEVERSKKK